MNEPKTIKCPYCGEIAADFNGEIICGNPACEAYPKIISAKSATLEDKIRALLSSGPKTIDLMAERVKELRGVVSGILYQMKANHEVSSEYDSKQESFVWRLINTKQVQLLSFEQKSHLIKNALEAGKHLPRAIAQFTKMTETETIITLTQMEENGEIARKNESNFSAWFKGTVPKGKLILDGNGGVIEIKATELKVSDDEWKKAQALLEKQNERINEQIRKIAGKTEMQKNTEDKNITEVAEMFSKAVEKETEKVKQVLAEVEKNNQIINQKFTEVETSYGAPVTAEKGSPVKKGIEYTEEMFEEYGRKGTSKRKIALDLGIKNSSVDYQLKKDNFLTAYQRGLAIFKQKPEGEQVKRKRICIEWTEEKLEDLASRYFEVNLAAKEADVAYTVINRHLNKEINLLAAWFRGMQKYLKAHPNYKIHPKSWYFKAQKMGLKLVEPQEDVAVAAEKLKTFVSKFDYIEVILDGENGSCHLKCKHCFMNRSFNLFQDSSFDNERIEEALKEFEADHQDCVISEPKPVEPVFINNRIAETMERIQPTKQVGIVAQIGRGIQLPSLNQFSNDITELEPVENPNQKSLSLSGGNLNLNLENFNLFEADERTRMFLHNLINQIQEFEEENLSKISHE